MAKLDQKKQKSLWLTLRTWRGYDALAHKRHVRPAELMRQALVEWLEREKSK